MRQKHPGRVQSKPEIEVVHKMTPAQILEQRVFEIEQKADEHDKTINEIRTILLQIKKELIHINKSEKNS